RSRGVSEVPAPVPAGGEGRGPARAGVRRVVEGAVGGLLHAATAAGDGVLHGRAECVVDCDPRTAGPPGAAADARYQGGEGVVRRPALAGASAPLPKSAVVAEGHRARGGGRGP